ncbi:uncharacterized protein LOC117293209 [Asterias rubens]|uniref:uncharacterized protein LOC117293209 n=1 Tax=Asterias rubens TaxID=7604 RepID=UPI000FECC37C|nr:uncharacterized protein LOC117293209 [Asterias rubens]
MAKLFLLVALVGFLALVADTEASCQNEATTCEAGTQFTEGCNSCSCSADGQVKSCCTSYMTPLTWTEGCESNFNAVDCVYNVTPKDGSNAVCEIFSAVG